MKAKFVMLFIVLQEVVWLKSCLSYLEIDKDASNLVFVNDGN